MLGLEFSTGNDSEFLLRLVDGHKKVEILPLSTVIRHLEIQVSEKRHRNPGQGLVFPAQGYRILIAWAQQV